MKLIVTLSDMVGVGLFALTALVWIIFIIIALINLTKDNIKYRIDKWKREREAMKEWERSNNGETDRKKSVIDL